MTYSPRTVTPCLLSSQSHRHEVSLTVFCDSDGWSAVQWPLIARDAEWLYRASPQQ